MNRYSKREVARDTYEKIENARSLKLTIVLYQIVVGPDVDGEPTLAPSGVYWDAEESVTETRKRKRKGTHAEIIKYTNERVQMWLETPDERRVRLANRKQKS